MTYIKQNNGETYAIKRIKIDDFNEEEIQNMKILNECENSIKLFGYFKDENLIYLIMELCDDNLAQKIKEKKNFTIKEIKELLEQLNNVFKIMNDNAIIHRDIKPENILIKNLENNKCLYKLIDYGFSKQLTQSHKASTQAGTIEYIAPEIINNLNVDKSKVDLWSIGILIHELYFGNTPENNIIQKTNNKYLDDLISKLLIKNPFDDNNNNNCRISWEDYFNHNFFKNSYKKEIEKFKKSLFQFNKSIKQIINFIIEKLENFNNLINKEIENIFTDEYNENLKIFSNLLTEFYSNNNGNKFNEMFEIFNKSILNLNEILEHKIYLNKDKLNNETIIKEKNNKNINLINRKENDNNDKLEYDGEYFNGKVKKHVNNDKIEFEGEYLNGERNGKGKEYDNNGKLIFEGEYLNGKRNGKGKEYYTFNGKLQFEGEYLNDKKTKKEKNIKIMVN